MSTIQQKTLASRTEQRRSDKVYGKTPHYMWKISVKTSHISSKENIGDRVECQR